MFISIWATRFGWFTYTCLCSCVLSMRMSWSTSVNKHSCLCFWQATAHMHWWLCLVVHAYMSSVYPYASMLTAHKHWWLCLDKLFMLTCPLFIHTLLFLVSICVDDHALMSYCPYAFMILPWWAIAMMSTVHFASVNWPWLKISKLNCWVNVGRFRW